MARDRLVAMGILPPTRTERECLGLVYPIPLRDIDAVLFMPRDLTEAEAEKLCAIIRLCVVPVAMVEKESLSAGHVAGREP